MASRGVNKVIIVGNLGAAPEVRPMNNDGLVANITVATSETWRDKATGEQREKTEWHRVSLFGKLAEIARDYLNKGSQVYLEGQLQTRKWQDQSGQDRYSTEIVVQGYQGVLQMLGSRQEGQPQGKPHQGQPHQGQPHQGQPHQGQPHQGQPHQGQPHQGQPHQGQSHQGQSHQGQPHQGQTQSEGGWGKPQDHQYHPQHNYQHQPSNQHQPQYNEPPMDFDDDIPF